MVAKQVKSAAFGARSARFDVSGIHPQSKTPGTVIHVSHNQRSCGDREIGPGRYDVDYGGFSARAVEQRAAGPGWARAQEVERLAALPHLLYKEKWLENKLLKTKLSPGTYEYKDFLQVSNEKPCSTRGMLQQCEQRFKDKINWNPGPGTYGKGGIPAAATEAKNRESMSTIGMLENAVGSRSLPLMGCQLGPGTYNFRSSTQQTLDHVVGNLAPFDQLSAVRSKPLKTGHYAKAAMNNLGPGQYGFKSSLDKWQSAHRKHHGRFGTQAQHPDRKSERIFAFCLSHNPRCATEPGPGQYDANDMNLTSQSSAQKSPPFLLSAVRCDKMATKFFTGNFNPVGPGRYDVQRLEDSHDKNGVQSVFKSKSSARLDNKHSQFMRERIREKDVALKDRHFLVPPALPETCRTQLNPPAAHFTSHRAITVL